MSEPTRPVLNLEQKTISVQFQPSDAFLSACTALEDDERFMTIVEELSERVPQLAIAACHINDEKFSHWVAGRVQELKDIAIIFRETRRVMEARRVGMEKAAKAKQAM
jgi:hypothetical protein